MIRQYFSPLQKLLKARGISAVYSDNTVTFRHNERSVSFLLADDADNSDRKNDLPLIFPDQLQNAPEKIAAIILSKLDLNKRIFARKCSYKKVERAEAVEFLEKYHLLGAPQTAFNRALFFEDEMMALASFSKGRKMNRLSPDERSFELIRFCCKAGITVSGGLSKLVRNFCEEKSAGDIMTYVDKQWSDGRPFISAGFREHSETAPNNFLVNRLSNERIPFNEGEPYDENLFYKVQNLGNIKMIYTPPED